MRVLLAIAMLGFGIAAGSAARAADIPTGSPGTYFERGQRSEMLWLYDDQSGVVVRASPVSLSHAARYVSSRAASILVDRSASFH